MMAHCGPRFREAIADLERQIDELKRLAAERSVDVAEENRSARAQARELRLEIYRNLTPLQRVQVARSARRPFTLDYVRLCFTDWIELHGDRAFRRGRGDRRRLPRASTARR
jgi:acetyl-CoA carboxylase carboxyl transferase subunit alpha